MRKAILYAIFALSVNTYAQVKQPTLSSEYLLSGLKEDIRKSFKLRERKTHSISSKLDKGKLSQPQKMQASSSKPVYDDIYVWKWDIPGNQWVYDSRTINLVYDINNNLISSVDQKWNSTIWVNDQQVTYSYDVNNLTDELWQQWNGTTWVNDSKYATTYDANNNITSEIAQIWNGSDWDNDFQSLYTYDSNNNRTKFVQQLWDGSIWGDSYQEISTYNTDNNVTYKLSQYWDGSIWTNAFQDNYDYDAGKKLISILEESFNTSEVWENYSQSTFTYDTNNNLINELVETWNSGAWENYSNYIFTYDGSNNMKTNIVQMWNADSWVQTSLSSNTYNINNLLESETNRYWTNAVLTSGDSTYYDFHAIATGINELITDTLTVFPNPGNGRFTIKNNNTVYKIEIFNLSGGIVYSDLTGKKQNLYEIDISYCTKGIYLLKVFTGEGIINKKVIIK